MKEMSCLYKVITLIYGLLYVSFVSMTNYFSNLNESRCYGALFLWQHTKKNKYEYISNIVDMVTVTGLLNNVSSNLEDKMSYYISKIIKLFEDVEKVTIFKCL